MVVRELRKSGYDPKWQRVDTQTEFMNCLAEDPPDVIISDHVMPQFSSMEALQCIHDSRLSIPFIVVSHAIGDEEAVGLIRNGAADYILKDRMARLGEAVRHAMEKRQLRSQYAEAQQDLRLLNQELEKRIIERTAELEVANSMLARELSERKQIEEQLRHLTGTLEERVKERTLQLSTSYARLRALATDLTVAEQKERRRLATGTARLLGPAPCRESNEGGSVADTGSRSGSMENVAECRSIAPSIARLHEVAGVRTDTASPVRERTERSHSMAGGSNAPAKGAERRD